MSYSFIFLNCNFLFLIQTIYKIGARVKMKKTTWEVTEMRVAIIGSRNCENLRGEEIRRHIPPGCTLIISGGAVGIDRLAEQAAAEQGIPFQKILPDYEAYGRNAPLVRNELIVERAELVLAFWDYKSRGTAFTIAACIERQVPVEIIGLDIVNEK